MESSEWLTPGVQYGTMALGVLICGAAIWFAMRRGRFSKWGIGTEFLCDSCKYNNERDCNQPDRPNATSCSEYKSRV